jgi:hypothetical protein
MLAGSGSVFGLDSQHGHVANRLLANLKIRTLDASQRKQRLDCSATRNRATRLGRLHLHLDLQRLRATNSHRLRQPRQAHHLRRQ